MTGPKVIYFLSFEKRPLSSFCFIYFFVSHQNLSSLYLLPRLILPMQVACRWVRKAEYVSANISLLGTGGTAQTARSNFLLTKASEVVRYVHKCELFISKNVKQK